MKTMKHKMQKHVEHEANGDSPMSMMQSESSASMNMASNAASSNSGSMQSSRMMMGGVSNTMIAILVLVVLVVSVIGTWAILNSIPDYSSESLITENSKSSASLQIEIIPQHEIASTSGMISLNIVR